MTCTVFPYPSLSVHRKKYDVDLRRLRRWGVGGGGGTTLQADYSASGKFTDTEQKQQESDRLVHTFTQKFQH